MQDNSLENLNYEAYLQDNSQLVSESYPYLNETLFQGYTPLVNEESAQAEIEKDHLPLDDVENEQYNLALMFANFPYLENANLDDNNATNIEREIFLQDNSALTLVDLQGNLILATDDFFFFQQ